MYIFRNTFTDVFTPNVACTIKSLLFANTSYTGRRTQNLFPQAPPLQGVCV